MGTCLNTAHVAGSWLKAYPGLHRSPKSFQLEKPSKEIQTLTQHCLVTTKPLSATSVFIEHFHHFPEQPAPMSDHPFSKDIFPNIQFKP